MGGTADQTKSRPDAQNATVNTGTQAKQLSQVLKVKKKQTHKQDYRERVKDITLELVNELFLYDEDTGILNNRVSRGPASSGNEAGWDDGRYRVVEIRGTTVSVHRVIWLMKTGHLPQYPKELINHKNHITTDNWWLNLELVTYIKNNQDAKLRKDNKLGIRGVHWCTRTNRYKAQIQVNKHKISLGVYHSVTEAVKARAAAEVKHNFHGIEHSEAHKFLRENKELTT